MSSRAALSSRTVNEPRHRDAELDGELPQRRPPGDVRAGYPAANTARGHVHSTGKVELGQSQLVKASGDPLAHGFGGHASRFGDSEAEVKEPVRPFRLDHGLRTDVPARSPSPPRGDVYSIDADWKRRAQERLEELGLDQKTLAERIGVPAPTLHGIIVGKTKTSEKIPDIHKALGWAAPGRATATPVTPVPIASTDVPELSHIANELTDEERLAVLILSRSRKLEDLSLEQWLAALALVKKRQ